MARRTVVAVALAGLGVSVVLPDARSEETRPLLEAPFAQDQRALSVQGEQYGLLSTSHPLVQRVDGIFGRLVRVSGRRPGAVFDVHVLDTPKILVHALPGGTVVISLGAVERAGPDDSAVAFLLAHEIAHVVRDHHSLLDSYQQVGLTTAPGTGTRVDERRRALQALELEADRLGVLYASLAGYRSRAAIPVLERILALTGSGPFHPEPRQRADAIRASLSQITAQVELFALGLVYLATQRYEEATRIYQTFVTLYPSREVYNNLGVAYHKWALLYRRDDGWLRGVSVDARSRARATLRDPRLPEASILPTPRVTEVAGHVHPLFRKHLDRALWAYRLAVESDPDYAVGHDNLGLAYLDGGELEFAIGQFKRAIRADPDFKSAWNHRGVAYARSGDAGRAESDFLRAATLDPSYPNPHGNLAKLFESLGRRDLAEPERQIYERLRGHGGGRTSPTTEPEKLARLAVGTTLTDAVMRRAGLSRFTVPLGSREEEALTVLVNESARLLIATRRGRVEALGALDGSQERTRAGASSGSSLAAVRSAYGTPATIERGAGSEIWIYPGHGLVFVVGRDGVDSWWVTPRSENDTR